MPVAWWVIALVAWAPVAMLGLLYVNVSGKVLAVLLSAEVVVIMVYSIGDLTHPADGSITYDMLAPANLVSCNRSRLTHLRRPGGAQGHVKIALCCEW